VEESVCYHKLDHDNHEVEEFAEDKPTKVDVVSDEENNIK
jgi:hypothetical protein